MAIFLFFALEFVGVLATFHLKGGELGDIKNSNQT